MNLKRVLNNNLFNERSRSVWKRCEKTYLMYSGIMKAKF